MWFVKTASPIDGCRIAHRTVQTVDKCSHTGFPLPHRVSASSGSQAVDKCSHWTECFSLPRENHFSVPPVRKEPDASVSPFCRQSCPQTCTTNTLFVVPRRSVHCRRSTHGLPQSRCNGLRHRCGFSALLPIPRSSLRTLRGDDMLKTGRAHPVTHANDRKERDIRRQP